LEKRLKNYIQFILRKASVRWKPRNEAKVRARVSRGQYKCSVCAGIFRRTEVEMDHKEPVVPLDTTYQEMSLELYCERLLVPVDGWQCVCKECHAIKSGLENSVRAEYKGEVVELDIKEFELIEKE
jgi:hypothetical protein